MLKKIIIFEKIVFFYLSIVSFINLSLISISFFVARVKSFMYSGAAFVLTEVTTFLHCLWTVKFQCVYSALLNGFKEDHTFDPYFLCFSFYYPFFLLLLCIEMWTFFVSFFWSTYALSWRFAGFLSVFILILSCHLLCQTFIEHILACARPYGYSYN